MVEEHSTQFSIMTIIAKQILATPMSTVTVQQAFSTEESILGQTRSSMSPNSVEAQACLDDWTKAALRQQESVHEQNEDYGFDDPQNGRKQLR